MSRGLDPSALPQSVTRGSIDYVLHHDSEHGRCFYCPRGSGDKRTVWAVCVNRQTGQQYFHCSATGDTVWELPDAVPTVPADEGEILAPGAPPAPAPAPAAAPSATDAGPSAAAAASAAELALQTALRTEVEAALRAGPPGGGSPTADPGAPAAAGAGAEEGGDTDDAAEREAQQRRNRLRDRLTQQRERRQRRSGSRAGSGTPCSASMSDAPAPTPGTPGAPRAEQAPPLPPSGSPAPPPGVDPGAGARLRPLEPAPLAAGGGLPPQQPRAAPPAAAEPEAEAEATAAAVLQLLDQHSPAPKALRTPAPTQGAAAPCGQSPRREPPEEELAALLDPPQGQDPAPLQQQQQQQQEEGEGEERAGQSAEPQGPKAVTLQEVQGQRRRFEWCLAAGVAEADCLRAVRARLGLPSELSLAVTLPDGSPAHLCHELAAGGEELRLDAQPLQPPAVRRTLIRHFGSVPAAFTGMRQARGGALCATELRRGFAEAGCGGAAEAVLHALGAGGGPDAAVALPDFLELFGETPAAASLPRPPSGASPPSGAPRGSEPRADAACAAPPAAPPGLPRPPPPHARPAAAGEAGAGGSPAGAGGCCAASPAPRLPPARPPAAPAPSAAQPPEGAPEGAEEGILVGVPGVIDYPSGSQYRGGVLDDRRHGTGHLVQRDDQGRTLSQYDGHWSRDRRHGRGAQAWAGLGEYAGQWEDDAMHGEGVLRHQEFQLEGTFERGAPHGHCRVEFPNGDVMSGTFAEGGSRVPLGEITYSNGDTYQWKWKNPHSAGSGRAVLRYKSGDSYEGELLSYRRHGKGVMRFRDGHEYEGEFHQGLMQGQGRFSYASGSRYEGGWLQNKFHGRGVYHDCKGSAYEGEWIKGRMHGKGLMTYPNGDQWEGEWKEDRRMEGRYVFSKYLLIPEV